MKTCFLVLGVPRSGTSVTAGVLHHLGVFMGDRFLPTTRMNSKGFFHDLDFEMAWTIGGVGELIAKRQALGKMWGVNTRRSINAPLIAAAGPTKLIVTNRPLQSIKASCEKWFKTSDFIDKALAELNQAVDALKLPTLRVAFDELIDSPKKIIGRIAELIGMPATKESVAFVDPSMRNF